MTESEAETLYDQSLDEMGIESLNLPPAHIVLKEVDSTMYDCGFADFCDMEGIELED
ncbi:hypothetical protein KAR91_78695 [Candidatus Pacearchaeota archaeon]|nr:hypothetical protein [Candidatus Pacearchaeota archaeon]